MGEEISNSNFNASSFKEFNSRLYHETTLLTEWFNRHCFDEVHLNAGVELEAWLINKNFHPSPINDRFLALANNRLLAPELARFNVELNNTPQALSDNCLSLIKEELEHNWLSCVELAHNLDAEFGLFGILPTLQASDLVMEHISESNRFAALNEQVLAQRKGRPMKVEITGHEHLRIVHSDVMLESAATSFQLHLQIPSCYASRYYNASLLASAATVAIAANSPFLFGKQLWAETRIPLFEQAVEVGGYAGAAHGPLKRVSFGSAYLQESVLEAFQENLNHYPVLLPTLFDTKKESLPHLRLHNGTIWRWNRPLIGFGADNKPHIRIEHRVMPAGPTITDMIANAAFYYGFAHACAQQTEPPEKQVNFATCKDNFYKAARLGLDAKIKWLDNKTLPLKKLILKTFLPMAREGLEDLKFNNADMDYYLNIIHERVSNEQNGSQWQIDFVRRTGHDMRLLTENYLSQQRSNTPVHTWELPSPAKKTKDPELQILSEIPEQLLSVDAKHLYTILKGPTLFILEKEKTEGIFVSVLLHGNEDSGLIAMQQVLRKYKNKPLPRSLYLFIGNIDAARYGLRKLSGQTDYNRAWPGTPQAVCAESKLLAKVYEIVKSKKPFLSLDLHNNTGLNPHYACINKLENRFLRLALLFSRTVVYFVRPRGVQSQAMAQICPSTTIECGKVGDNIGIERAKNFIDVCLNLKSLSDEPIANQDIDLFHTVAQIKINEKVSFSFEGEPADLHFSHDLEYMNFRELTSGTPLGDCAQMEQAPLRVINAEDEDVYHDYFVIENGLLRIKRPIMPSMLTTDERIIRQDCFCYLMERIAPPGAEKTTWYKTMLKTVKDNIGGD